MLLAFVFVSSLRIGPLVDDSWAISSFLIAIPLTLAAKMSRAHKNANPYTILSKNTETEDEVKMMVELVESLPTLHALKNFLLNIATPQNVVSRYLYTHIEIAANHRIDSMRIQEPEISRLKAIIGKNEWMGVDNLSLPNLLDFGDDNRCVWYWALTFFLLTKLPHLTSLTLRWNYTPDDAWHVASCARGGPDLNIIMQRLLASHIGDPEAEMPLKHLQHLDFDCVPPPIWVPLFILPNLRTMRLAGQLANTDEQDTHEYPESHLHYRTQYIRSHLNIISVHNSAMSIKDAVALLARVAGPCLLIQQAWTSEINEPEYRWLYVAIMCAEDEPAKWRVKFVEGWSWQDVIAGWEELTEPWLETDVPWSEPYNPFIYLNEETKLDNVSRVPVVLDLAVLRVKRDRAVGEQ